MKRRRPPASATPRAHSKAVVLRQQLKRHLTPAPGQVRRALSGMVALTTLTVQPSLTALQTVMRTGELHVVGVSSPSTVVQQDGHAHGLQYELARAFAQELGVQLVVDPADSNETVIHALQHNQAQLALPSLTLSDPRLASLKLSGPVVRVDQQLVQAAGKPGLRDRFDLSGKTIGVIADSSEALTLRTLLADVPDAQLIEFRRISTKVLLDLLAEDKVDVVALHSHDFDAHRPLYPSLVDSLPLKTQDAMAWAFLNAPDNSLYEKAEAFLQRKRADGSLDRLAAFYHNGSTFNRYGSTAFQRDLGQKLPRYQSLFEDQADETDLDWRLLAAIAYQESRWDAQAVSPTGVRGLMMLTESTARAMGVRNRVDPTESIQGGARYFQHVLNNIPDSVPNPDRVWMALAAYNMGPAHIRSARRLTERWGRDPDNWHDVSSLLPRFAAERRRRGQAAPDVRQALHYVQQVRRYYDAIALATEYAPGAVDIAALQFNVVNPGS